MSFLRFVEKGKTVEIHRAGACVAWLRAHGGERWTLLRVEDARTMDELANIRGHVLEVASKK